MKKTTPPQYCISAGFPATKLQLKQLMHEAAIPGISMAVIKNTGAPVYLSAGVRDLTGHQPVNALTVFQAASLTKPVLALAALRLTEAGLIRPNTMLWPHLPATRRIADERTRQITMAMALSHTTGLPNWCSGALSLQYAPGSVFSYSGEGYMLLQQALEDILQQPIAGILRDMVFRPLQMKHSYMSTPAVPAGRLATGYNASGAPADCHYFEQPNAAASLYTTAADYARLLSALLDNTLLRPATRKKMLRPHVQVSDSYPSLAWALGWGVEQTPDGPVYFHWGNNNGFKSYALFSTDTPAAMVYFTNSDNGLRILPQITGRDYAHIEWLGYTKK